MDVSDTDALMDIMNHAMDGAPLPWKADILAQRWGWSREKAHRFVTDQMLRGHVQTTGRSQDYRLVMPSLEKMKTAEVRRQKAASRPRFNKRTPPNIFYLAAAEELLETERVHIKVGITHRLEGRMKDQSGCVEMKPLFDVPTPYARQLERVMKIAFSDFIPSHRASTETIVAPEGMSYTALFDTLKSMANHIHAIMETLPRTTLAQRSHFDRFLTPGFCNSIQALARNEIARQIASEKAAATEPGTSK